MVKELRSLILLVATIYQILISIVKKSSINPKLSKANTERILVRGYYASSRSKSKLFTIQVQHCIRINSRYLNLFKITFWHEITTPTIWEWHTISVNFLVGTETYNSILTLKHLHLIASGSHIQDFFTILEKDSKISCLTWWRIEMYNDNLKNIILY